MNCTVTLLVALGLGAVGLQLGYFITNPLRTQFLPTDKGENESLTVYEVYETVVLNFIIALQAMEYCVLSPIMFKLELPVLFMSVSTP